MFANDHLISLPLFAARLSGFCLNKCGLEPPTNEAIGFGYGLCILGAFVPDSTYANSMHICFKVVGPNVAPNLFRKYKPYCLREEHLSCRGADCGVLKDPVTYYSCLGMERTN